MNPIIGALWAVVQRTDAITPFGFNIIMQVYTRHSSSRRCVGRLHLSESLTWV